MTISAAHRPPGPPQAPARHRILVWAQTRVGRRLGTADDEINFLRTLEDERAGIIRVEIAADECWADLPAWIIRYQPTILHYIGHGRRGSLRVLDRDGSGFPGEVDIGPEQLAVVLRAADTSLRGVFLNGCETAHWAPHLIPRDGWIVGMNHKVDDHLASEFSAVFYMTLLLDGASSDHAYETALREASKHPHFTEGNIVRWVEDPNPDDFLHKVFSRQAFLTSALEENSLTDLSDALEGVRRALTTHGLALRKDLGVSGQVSCRTPLDKSLVKPLLTRLKVAVEDLQCLRRSFPSVVNYADGWTTVPDEETDHVLRLADRLDSSRNALLSVVNEHLPDHKRFPMIALTSTTGRWPSRSCTLRGKTAGRG